MDMLLIYLFLYLLLEHLHLFSSNLRFLLQECQYSAYIRPAAIVELLLLLFSSPTNLYFTAGDNLKMVDQINCTHSTLQECFP